MGLATALAARRAPHQVHKRIKVSGSEARKRRGRKMWVRKGRKRRGNGSGKINSQNTHV